MKTAGRIYPAVGIAYIGNSERTYFLGPESPGIVPAGPYRDNSGKIKPQAPDSGLINSFAMISARKPSTARSLGMKKTTIRSVVGNATPRRCDPRLRAATVSRGIEDYVDMVRWWTELGFIVKKDDQYEDERRPIARET